MARATLDRHVLTDLSWWHWALTIPLLAAHLAGSFSALATATGLCIVVGGYFFHLIQRIRPYPVQVRIAYLGLLIVGVLPWMNWIHWIQLCGTTAMVTVGYCPLIRLLSLLPLNNDKPLTISLVWRAFVLQPCAGGLVKRRAKSPSAAVNCCSLAVDRPTMECSLSRIKGVIARGNN
ncbi:hypothetical protein I41_27690 [Lacipirellula limnantheis]|uniref:Uncharacterized protein n=1 Tax=Lacipirellula limnantheis TaxID=2528024 RepID=A0A517TYX7_9BACT|nr:hypothetical protein I41_27690 [Lacipirellula limnantheis]